MLSNVDMIVDIILFLLSLTVTILLCIKNHNNKNLSIFVTLIFAIKIIYKFFK